MAYGYSVFCDLFTYEEWEGFAYDIDIEFTGGSGFQSSTGVRSPYLQILDQPDKMLICASCFSVPWV